MTALRKRAYALENRYIREQELTFRAEARRNALVGLWAATFMKHPAAEAYAREIVALGVEHPEAVIDRLDDDLQDKMTAMLKHVVDEMYSH